MSSKLVYKAIAVAMTLLVAGMAVIIERAYAPSVIPIVVDRWKSGNASFECIEAASYTGVPCLYSYKVDNNTAGGCTVHIIFNDGLIMEINIINSNGYTFDWSSNYAITTIIVKAGTGANIFFYENGATSDTGLFAYENREISHVTFCWNWGMVPPSALIAIAKYGPDYAHVNDTITYEYCVWALNGNFTGVNVHDDKAGEATYVRGDDGDNILEIGETWIYNATYTVKATDPDPLVNNATVYATYNNQQVSAWDTWTVDILHPAISVSKVANVSRAYAGDVIEYTINVTNAGDCTLYNVNVTDILLLEEPLTIEELGVGESENFTLTYTVNAGDPDPLKNTVTVKGKDALGLVVSANTSASVDLIAKICGYKFYDSNTNGEWDDGEPGVEGIKIRLFKDGELINEIFTDENGYYCFDELNAGNYTIVEVLPDNWINTTSTSITVELKSGEISEDNNFGNICLMPGYGGKTLGYWANAGNKLINSSDVGYLNTLNLYRPNGWNYPKFSTEDIGTARTQIRNYLLSANAKDMKWMLSAQLIATALNVRHGYLSNSTIVYVGPSKYVPSGFISISKIIEHANTALTGTNRAEQTYWKNILDWLNNNKLYFVCPEPCKPSYP